MSEGVGIYISTKRTLEKYINAAKGDPNAEANIYLSGDIIPKHIQNPDGQKSVVCQRCWMISDFTPWLDLLQTQLLIMDNTGLSKKMEDIEM